MKIGVLHSKKKKSDVSLGVSLTILSGTLLFLSFFVIIFVLVAQQKQSSLIQTRNYGETVFDNLTQAVELSEYNQEWMQAYVVAVSTNPGILQIAILDKQGHTIAHSDPKKKGKVLSDVPRELGNFYYGYSALVKDPDNGKSFLRFAGPITFFPGAAGNEGTALVDVALPEKIQMIAAGNSFNFFLGILALFACNIGILFLFLHQRVIRIARNLTAAAGRLTKGHFDERIAVDRNDELGQLASSFNIMAQTLGETTVSRNYFDNIIRSMGDSLIVLDADLNIVRVNQATLTLLGYEEEELVGQQITDIILQAKEASADHAFWLPEKPIIKERFYVAKDGQRIPVLISRSFIEGAEEKRAGIVLVAKDIIERLRAEEEIRQANISLRESHRKLQQTQEQLVQSAKLASLGEMAAGIAHELNQPLHIIGMSAELGNSYLQMGNYDKVKSRLVTIVQQIQRATAIINHLRTFGRDASRMDKNDHDVNRIIEDTFILFNEQFRVRGIDIDKNLGREIPVVTCNPIQIEQVLSNILVNSKDAMEKCTSKIISITSRAEGKNVIIEVRDTGPGVESSVQNKIFDPFFTTKEVGKGTGLGLSISYGIIKDHGGTIEVESEPGRGTLFRILLPSAKGIV